MDDKGRIPLMDQRTTFTAWSFQLLCRLKEELQRQRKRYWITLI